MAQAESVTTAIRELMSRGEPPKSTSPARAAHAEFVAGLAGNVPRRIHPEANSKDLEGRAEHLGKVFAALHVYLTAIIADAARTIPGSTLDRRYPDDRFQEFSADALGVIRNAAEKMRVHENWRVSRPFHSPQHSFTPKISPADPSSAARMPGSSWAATRPPLPVYGGRSGARRSSPTTQRI
jgi:hypothetical protein